MLRTTAAACAVLVLAAARLHAAPRHEQRAHELTALAAEAGDKPLPGLGVFCTSEELAQIRRDIQDPEHIRAMFWARLLSQALRRGPHYTQAAFIYCVTGDPEMRDLALAAVGEIPPYADDAWKHWGEPHVLPMFDTDQPRYFLAWLDFVWSALSEEQRTASIGRLADALRWNWRFGVLAEGHSMLHPRLHTNQAFTYVGSWLMTAAALRGRIPDGERLFRSVLQTYLWQANMMGDPDGMDLVRENEGYFYCGFCGWLGAAEAVLRLTGIDLYTQPFMRQLPRRKALYTGVVRPYNPDGSRREVGPEDRLRLDMVWGSMTHKVRPRPEMAYSLPAQRYGHPDARYWWHELAFREDGGLTGDYHGAHLGRLGPVMGVTWTGLADVPPAPAPDVADFAISRLLGYARFRTGTQIGDLLCMAGSDYFFLDAFDESLIAGQNGGWHMPLYTYARGRSTVLVEDQPQAITRILEEAFAVEGIEYIQTRRPADTAESYLGAHGSSSSQWREYDSRDRVIVFARPDYVAVLDELALAGDAARRVELQWMFNILGAATVTVDRAAGAIRLDRPLASLSAHVLYPGQAVYDERTMQMQEVGGPGYDSHDGIRAVRIGMPTTEPSPVEPRTLEWSLFKPDKGYTEPLAPDAGGVVSITTVKDSWDWRYLSDPIPIRGGELCVLGTEFRKRDMPLEQASVFVRNPGIAWQVDVAYQDGDAQACGQESFHIVKPKQADVEWTKLARRLDPPKRAATMTVALRFWHQERKNRSVPAGTVWLKPFALRPPAQNVRRVGSAGFFTLLVPRRRDQAPPRVTRMEGADSTTAVVDFAGRRDTWIYSRGQGLAAIGDGGAMNGKLALIGRGRGATKAALFQGTRLTRKGGEQPEIDLSADRPVLLTLSSSAHGQAGGKVRTYGPTSLSLVFAGLEGSVELPRAGHFLVRSADGNWVVQPGDDPLDLEHTSARQSSLYAQGLEPLTAKLLAERDAADGTVNCAASAKVTASASLDDRFGPERVVDNETVEYGRDGRVDFRIGSLPILPHQLGWYAGQDRLPLRVRPTYWLLPDGELGSVTLELPEPRQIAAVRLLNTQNQGQNDRAAIDVRVDVTTPDGEAREVYAGRFGDPVPSARFGMQPYPDNATWGNTWAEQTPVPLYLGWKTIELDGAPLARSVTVHVESFWGRGGGLNEIQLLTPAQGGPGHGEPIVEDDFSDGLDNWVAEGYGSAEVREGRLVLDPAWKRPDGSPAYGAMNIWCRQELPAGFRWEFDYYPIRDKGQNLVFMLAARLMDGTDLIERAPERTGHYIFIINKESAFSYKEDLLGDRRVPPMQCYTVSYWLPDGRRVPARKNPGHHLLGDAARPADELRPGRSHHMVIVKRGGEVRFLEDGKELLRFVDEGGQEATAFTRHADGTLTREEVTLPVYGKGYIGIRTLGAVAAFDNVRVYALPAAGE